MHRYLLSLADIPHLDKYLLCLSFKNDFREIIKDLKEPIENMKKSIIAVKESKELRRFMAYILHIGNYMNGGTNRGQADGFDLSVLEQLLTVKGSQGKTLIDYVVGLVTYNGVEPQWVVSNS